MDYYPKQFRVWTALFMGARKWSKQAKFFVEIKRPCPQLEKRLEAELCHLDLFPYKYSPFIKCKALDLSIEVRRQLQGGGLFFSCNSLTSGGPASKANMWTRFW